MKDYYEEYWGRRIEREQVTQMPRHTLVAATIKRILRPGANILELGAGEGHNLVNIGGEYSLSCCDISKAALELILVPGVRKVQCDLNSQFPFPGEKFDAIICTEVLEHLLRPAILLMRLRDALRPDGIAVISIPNTAHLEHRWTLLRGYFPLFDESHIHFWTIRDFLGLTASIGLDVQSWQSTYNDFWVFRRVARGPIQRLLSKMDIVKELFGREIVFVFRKSRAKNPDPGHNFEVPRLNPPRLQQKSGD
jgi:SAM-dependent methyltransferase